MPGDLESLTTVAVHKDTHTIRVFHVFLHAHDANSSRFEQVGILVTQPANGLTSEQPPWLPVTVHYRRGDSPSDRNKTPNAVYVFASDGRLYEKNIDPRNVESGLLRDIRGICTAAVAQYSPGEAEYLAATFVLNATAKLLSTAASRPNQS